ncbi:HAF repeat-containing PEP-CTERM protein [Nitrosovibrio sp. Nv4]|uniref:HAF repeat-containing PEP-CTERM protein n=1 Tax=Nitrosovibrio sp. Nv4 TaxID=1945880 RepID=UPI000BD625A6|nr:HAF repeat-containing PEP-CTERM protein [Nitrosovibrio sp. Nv4]SOD41946.1 PEP-CTERM protein-sorting domain-containing protein [Nitrosovibrio sp. Nv4]
MILNHCFKVRSFILAAALVTSLGPVNHANAQFRPYLVDLNIRTITPFDALGGDYNVAYDINNLGQVVLISLTDGGDTHAFITGPDGEGIRELDALAYALGINDAGQVVGGSSPAGGFHYHAFITGPDGMGMRDLGTLGGEFSMAHAINDAGQVMGISQISTGGQHMFVTGPNGMGMRDLGIFGDRGDINDAGQVVGRSYTAEGGHRAFITGPDAMGMRDPGTLGGDDSGAFGINDAGQVVGYSDTATGESHAFITGPDGLGMRDLGTLGGDDSWALGINDAGQVVGHSDTATGESHAFITGPDGEGMMDLNSLVDLPDGVFLSNATDINNAGQALVIAVPEPEIPALLLAGLALIGFMGRRKKTISTDV